MQRRFDPGLVETIRRQRGIPKTTLAKRLGYSTHSMVSAALSGDGTPPPEKLPAWADALGVDLDETFPRLDENENPVEPDLQDLRTDKGITMAQIPAIIGTDSPVPVRKAEQGKSKNPLKEEYAQRLAKAYGVSVAELRAAEARSRGSVYMPGPAHQTPTDAPPAPEGTQQERPATLAEVITHHLERMPTDTRPTDGDIAAAINARAGAAVITPSQVLALRTGSVSQEEIVATVAESVLHQGLADALKVPAITFQSSHEMVDHIVEYVHGLAERGDFKLQARGGSGISPQFAAKLMELLAEAKAETRGRKRGR